MQHPKSLFVCFLVLFEHLGIGQTRGQSQKYLFCSFDEINELNYFPQFQSVGTPLRHTFGTPI